jgi:hypothetical protein
MADGSTVFYVALIAIGLWFALHLRKIKYRLVALFLIALFIFGWFSISSAFSGKDASLGNFKGVSEAAGIYFTWLGAALGNAQAITSGAAVNDSGGSTGTK